MVWCVFESDDEKNELVELFIHKDDAIEFCESYANYLLYSHKTSEVHMKDKYTWICGSTRLYMEDKEPCSILKQSVFYTQYLQRFNSSHSFRESYKKSI